MAAKTSRVVRLTDGEANLLLSLLSRKTTAAAVGARRAICDGVEIGGKSKRVAVDLTGRQAAAILEMDPGATEYPNWSPVVKGRAAIARSLNGGGGTSW